jgi:hypothetical protein
MSAALEHHLIQVIQKNRWNELILSRAAQLGLEDWWLTAGCIAQSVWNFACDGTESEFSNELLDLRGYVRWCVLAQLLPNDRLPSCPGTPS